MRPIALAATLLLALAGLIALLPTAGAGQIDRSVARADGEVQFRIRFQDADRATRTLSFALAADAYDRARDGLTRVDSGIVERRVQRRVDGFLQDSRQAWRRAMRDRLAALAASVPDGVRMDYSVQGTELRWTLEGRGISQAALDRHAQRIEARLDRAAHRMDARRQADLDRYVRRVRAEVLRELDYVRDADLGGLIRPDYAKLAADQAEVLGPLAREIAQHAGRTARERTALALAFLQTVPYDELTARGAADGTGFAVPAQVLHLNRGDCDSKATALAALMQRLAPEVATAVVLLPGHAVLAADLAVRDGDRTLELDGRRFVLMEPAGPAVFPIGRIGADSRRLIDAGRVQSVVWMTGGPRA